MKCARATIVTLLAALAAAPAAAQPAPNLAGRTVQVIVGFGAGGGFDQWGRIVARHIGRHLPGHPTVVVQNMPGAGGFIAANHIYNVAPKDGTAIAIVASSTPLGPLRAASGARFDSTRLTWLGTPTIETNTCVAFNRPEVKVKALQDLYQHELVVGGTGPGAGTYAWPKGVAGILGMKFKVIGGFPSASNVVLAVERGELEGICNTGLDNLRPDWIPNKIVNVLFQGGVPSSSALKNVPFVIDLVKTAEQRSAIEFLYAGENIGRPFFAPPDLPPDRARMLQEAFMATMRDKEFLADADRLKLDVEPRDGAYLAETIRRIYMTPKAIVERVAELTKYDGSVNAMRRSLRIAAPIAASVALTLGLSRLHPPPAAAQPEPTLAGRTVQLLIGFGPGGGLDIWGRLVARHLGRHLPGQPAVVAQNMPGAGGIVAANHIYNVARKDGTAIAIVGSSAPLGALTGSGARFDPTRFTYLGTPTLDTNTCVALNSPQVKVKTLSDLYETELVVGASGTGAGSYMWPKGLSGLLGLKFKVVTGFPSAANVILAVERGEVEGICNTGLTNMRPDWISKKTVKVLLQGGAAGTTALKDVPFAGDLAKTPEQRAAIEFLYAGESIGRPFFAPPDLPPALAKALQDAFMATMRDPDFLADATRQKLEVDPRDGAYLTETMRRVYATPKAIVDRVAELTR